MAFIPVANTCQVELIGQLDSQVVENVIYVEDAAGWTVGKLATLGGVIVSWWDTDLQPWLSDSFQLDRLKLTDLTTVSSPSIEYVSGLPLVGGTAQEAMSNNVAVVVTFLTDLRGRSYRGRNYIAGLPTGNVDGNTVSTVWVDGVNDAYYALNTTLDGAGQAHVVVSRYTEGSARPSGVTTPITGYRTNNIVDSQRRRLPGRGN